MNKLLAFINVLKAGNEIDERVRLKHGTLAVNNIIILISSCVYFLNLFDLNIIMTNDQILSISAGIISIFALFNNVSASASSKDASINPIDNVKILLHKEVKQINSELAQKIRENS